MQTRGSPRCTCPRGPPRCRYTRATDARGGPGAAPATCTRRSFAAMTRGAGASIQGTPPQDDRRQRGDSPSPPVCAPAVPPSARVAGAVTRPGASRRSASSRKPRFSVPPRGRGASPAALLLGNGVEKGPEQAPGRNLSPATHAESSGRAPVARPDRPRPGRPACRAPPGPGQGGTGL